MMSQMLKINHAERRVYRIANFQDGLWDIYLGLILIVMSIDPLTRSLLGPIWNLVLILALTLGLLLVVNRLRQRLVAPRIGLVKLGERTLRKLNTAHMITLTLVLATLVLWIFSARNWLQEPIWDNLPRWVSDFDVDLLFMIVTIVFFSVIAYSMRVPRYYLHGVLMGVGNFISTVMLVYHGVTFQYPMLIAGMVILLVGSFVLSRFIKTYPSSQEDA
jgi:hypothetical protein